MKIKLIVLFLLTSTLGFTQKRGINFDPESKTVGDKPYEMATREEDKVPIALFDNCEKWIIKTENCEADLYLTSEQRLFRETSGKLVYKTTNENASISLLYDTPIVLSDPWDCIDFWTYGDHWGWMPDYKAAFKHYALIEGADGKIHELDFSKSGHKGLVHKYWFLSHIKMNEKIKAPAKFIGLKFKGEDTTPGKKQTVYLGPIYIYKEPLKELSFNAFPEKMPFPLREETILPINKHSVYSNEITKDGSFYRLTYQGEDMDMEYSLSLSKGVLNGIKVKTNNSVYDLCKGSEFIFTSDKRAVWSVKSEKIQQDTLYVEFIASVGKQKFDFSCWYTINQKSLIIGMHENSETGWVKEITLGETGKLADSKLITVPFLPYEYNRHPKLLYGDDLFFFKQFDWYSSDASSFTTNNSLSDGWANYNQGVEYIPKTNGERNPIREKLFINVSKDVMEVLPTIDNPASPMRSYQADRLWMIDYSANYEENKKRVRKFRSLGFEKITIRYHEEFWRDGGESYTFRTDAAPGRGGDEAVKEFIKYVKDQGWRIGLYSNYCDFAPVNKNWDPDWVLRKQDDSWQVSWPRCYAPKPMIALEQQALLAPIINKKFSPNHSYCDVHTAVSPMARVDYDYRVPGAATFRRTFECFGLLLLNEKKAYRAPVYSEGKDLWWYAGLTDGNYANFTPSINTLPIFPEFQLYKIHPLQMDAGDTKVNGAEYLAYTLAYGHIGLLRGDISEMMKRYAFLQTLQDQYSMVPVKEINYFDNKNDKFNSSQAIKNGLNSSAKLKIEYENGFTVYINFSEDNWRVYDIGKSFTLPKHGILAYSKDLKTFALSGMCDDFLANNNNYRIDLVKSKDQYYFDTYGSIVKTDSFEAEGKIFFKKEDFGWEIIPADDFKQFTFNLDLIDPKISAVIIEGVNEDDLPIEDAEIKYNDNSVNMRHDNKSIFKYRVVPAVKIE